LSVKAVTPLQGFSAFSESFMIHNKPLRNEEFTKSRKWGQIVALDFLLPT